MSEKQPKQEELFKKADIGKLTKEFNLFKGIQKEIGEKDEKRRLEEEKELRQKNIDEALNRKKSPENGDQ